MSLATYMRWLETGLGFVTRFLAPGPLVHLDRWLLLNRPWVWRTGVIPMLVLAALLGIGCFAFGRLTPISPKTMPTITDVSTVWSVMLLIGLIILGLWVITQIRWPQPTMSRRQFLYTGVVYVIVTFIFTIIPAGYSIPISVRMADAVPDEIFADEYAFHAAYNFWVCTTKIKEEPSGPTLRRIIQSLERYGFRDTFEYEPESFTSPTGSALCSTSLGSPPTLIFTLRNEGYFEAELGWSSRLFGERLKAVRAAKLAIASDTGELEGITTGSVMPTVILSGSAALLLLLFCPVSYFSIGARFVAGVWLRLPILRPRSGTLAVGRLISFKPSYHPTLYALAPIQILLSQILLIAVFVVLLWSGRLGNTADEVLTRLTEAFTIFFAVVLTLVLQIGIVGCHAKKAQITIVGNSKMVISQMVLYMASTTPIVVWYALISATYSGGVGGPMTTSLVLVIIMGSVATASLYLGFAILHVAALIVFVLGVVIGVSVVGVAALAFEPAFERPGWELLLLSFAVAVGGLQMGKCISLFNRIAIGYLVYAAGITVSALGIFGTVGWFFVHFDVLSSTTSRGVPERVTMFWLGYLLLLVLFRGRTTELAAISKRPAEY